MTATALFGKNLFTVQQQSHMRILRCTVAYIYELIKEELWTGFRYALSMHRFCHMPESDISYMYLLDDFGKRLQGMARLQD